MTENSKRPAFHVTITGVDRDLHSGLTKREYFVAMAMQAQISFPGTLDGSTNKTCQSIAKFSITMADIMLKELEKQSD